ncbi:MAG: helix-turn-helix transcriptional regulator [Ktedonobacterales bacterium]|nr:helix-turn-helix transcriptional regulator [Ktedonobacterales bacterium]
MADLFSVLADPTRAQVVHLLLHQELCSCDLAAALGMSAPRISQHLRVLRAAHVVKTRREGKLIIYTLDDAHVRLLFQLGLAHTGETVSDAVADIG